MKFNLFPIQKKKRKKEKKKKKKSKKENSTVSFLSEKQR